MKKRHRLFEIIEVSKDDDKFSDLYDTFMLVVIVISLVPLAFTSTNQVFNIIDKVSAVIFIIDYVFRFVTADYKLNRGLKSFVIYPFTPMAIIDLVSILPSVTILNSGWRILKVFRLLRTMRVFRVFKAVRYSKSIQIFIKVFRKQRDAFITIVGIAIMYILVAALVILNVEPETFGDYFHAIYWATISLTTMGYGDIYPVSAAGQMITMISSFIGIAIVAMPAGVITAGFMEELSKEKDE